jgi:sulfide:quinone oxidoreductase
LAGAAGAVILERSVHYFNQSGAKAKIVIVGGGAAGITMAAYLSRMIRDYDITIIEPNEKHYYQPGYTLIAAGVFTPGEVVKPTKDLIPDHVKWVKDSVTELHPDANTVVTAKEGKFSYDFLVLVPGCQMNFNLVEGISREELGKGNVHSIYDYNSAVRCWDAIKSLPNSNSRRLIFTNTYTKIKCGALPRRFASSQTIT